MSRIDELEDARQDLESLLLDVLDSTLGEEAFTTDEPLPSGPLATSRLSIHDEVQDTYLGIEVRVGAVLARLLASKMMAAGDPSPDDLLDAVGELGNIVGGNVKTLLYHTARLSLPMADLNSRTGLGDPDDPSTTMRVAASVFGQTAQMVLTPGAPADGLYWPPSQDDEALEKQP
jgi:hypothetical protein